YVIAADRGGDVGRRPVLRDVVRLEPRDDDLLDAGGVERGDFLGTDQGALLEHQIALADRMHRCGAERFADRDRAEFHAATAALSLLTRSDCVISAMIETAISAGDTAPSDRPMGA